MCPTYPTFLGFGVLALYSYLVKLWTVYCGINLIFAVIIAEIYSIQILFWKYAAIFSYVNLIKKQQYTLGFYTYDYSLKSYCIQWFF